MIRVLIDRHHGVLWEAWCLLFLDRAILGPAELRAWEDGSYVKAGHPPHQDWPERGPIPTADESWEPHLVIATVDATRIRMRELARRVGALYVDHLGNQWDDALEGTAVLRSRAGERGQLYHPEFHQVPWTAPTGRHVASFHNSFAELPCAQLWAALADDGWVMYGTPGHPLTPDQVALARRQVVATWVCKEADGYGFAVHEAFASGRAVIGHRSHYDNRLARELFQPGSYLEPNDTPGIMAMLRDPEPLGRAARARFLELVDFDQEALAVKAYLEGAMR